MASSSSSPSGVVEALERLVLSHPIVGLMVEKINEEKKGQTVSEMLAGMPAESQQSLLDGILEMEKEELAQEEEEKTKAGQLSTFTVEMCVDSPRYTHIAGRGPAVVICINDSTKKQTIILLKAEILISHLSKHVGAGLRHAREAADVEVAPIDYLPTPADPFRVFESDDVDCSMRQQLYYSGPHNQDTPPPNSSKRGRRSKEGGLVFVRDSYNAMQLCCRCVMSVVTSPQPLNGNLLHTRGVGQLNAFKHTTPAYAIPRRKESQGKD
jgi:hypothetical protein